ncbi:MAG: response regulator [Moraxellaceae bacterium]|nr:response regulator [Pseudobdellovibrionaceae bacterium]
MTVENIQFSLAEMLADFDSLMRFKAAEKGIGFKFTVDTLFPDLICSDPVRLRQILTNVIGNAIKFTDKGHVELCIEFVNPILKFTVKDTGVGISKDQESRLFQPFTQADASTTRKFGGTGLGLVLSKRLAEALDGKLELIKSQERFGSTFLIEVKSTLLPNAKLVGADSLTITAGIASGFHNDSQVLQGLKVLLVEDSPDNQMLISMYLHKEGAKVKTASNGAIGVELALTEMFDVVLMDIQMPILDGHEATKKLRQSKYSKPIIALTAHAMKEERAKCLESGFTEFLTKPIQKDLLIAVLSRYVSPTLREPFPI